MAEYSILQTFYASQSWLDFRSLVIMQRGMKCEYCGNAISKAAEMTLHHIKELTPDNVKDTSISLNPDNVMLVHLKCHNQIHNRFGIKKHNVYLVYGSPMSGKTSYVKDNIQRGDIVVDMDMLYQAMTMNDLYNKPSCLLLNVLAVHNLIIDNIKTRFGKWNNAWVVGGYADKYKRDKMIADLGAEPIFIDTSKQECIARLDVDESKKHLKKEYIGYINKWFEIYRA